MLARTLLRQKMNWFLAETILSQVTLISLVEGRITPKPGKIINARYARDQITVSFDFKFDLKDCIQPQRRFMHKTNFIW